MKHKETVHKYSLIFCLMLLPPVFLEHQHSEAPCLALSFAWYLKSSKSSRGSDMLNSLYFYMGISILFFTGTKLYSFKKGREERLLARFFFFFFPNRFLGHHSFIPWERQRTAAIRRWLISTNGKLAKARFGQKKKLHDFIVRMKGESVIFM